MPKRNRRAKGEGTIRACPDGRGYIGQIVIHVDGKRQRKTIRRDSQFEIEEAFDSLKCTGKCKPRSKLKSTTVGQLLSRYRSRLSGSASKILKYTRCIDKLLMPHFGPLRIESLNPPAIEDFYVTLQNRGQRVDAHRVLSSALTYAVRMQLISTNPCSHVKPPKRRRRRIIPLPYESLSRLIQSCTGTREYPLIVTACLTGMRQSELFGLDWKDVDLKHGTITVRQQFYECAGHTELKPPKSESGIRTITVPSAVINALRDTPRRSNFVFTTKHRRPLRASNFIGRKWPRILERAGLPYFRFHLLRHSITTLLVMAGVPLKAVQHQAGHANVQITLDCYTHLSPETQEAAAKHLDELFSLSADDHHIPESIADRQRTVAPVSS